jgi:hypothetical protein
MLIVAISASRPALAGLLTQQQPSNFADSREPMVSDHGSGIERGDTFTIQSASPTVSIGAVEWWGWYEGTGFGEMDFLDDYTLNIYPFENGAPVAQPVFSSHIGDIVENAVPKPGGGIRARDRSWMVAHDLGSGAGILQHRYEALFTDNPIQLNSGEQYLLSVVNNEPKGGIYIFDDPNPPVFIVDPSVTDLSWNWARADHSIDDQSSSYERPTGATAWSEISTPDVYSPDLAFSLYDAGGNVDPLVYLAADGVYRISNLRIGDKEYNVKFKWGTGSNISGDLEFFTVEEAVQAANAINALLNDQSPIPPNDTTSTNLSFPGSAAVYVVPFAVDQGAAIAVESIGPGEQFPNPPAPWFLGMTAFIPAAQNVMYADFLLIGQVPEPSTFVLVAVSLLGCVAHRRRRQSA